MYKKKQVPWLKPNLKPNVSVTGSGKKRTETSLVFGFQS